MHLPTFSTRRLMGAAATAGAAALAAGALAATSSPASASGGAVVASTPSCATSGLVVWLNTQGDGAAGSIYYHLELTNLSGHACTLVGYPGVSAVNLAGHQVGSAASHDPTRTPHLVTLAAGTPANMAGATANVVLRIVEAGNYPASKCHQVNVAGVRVYPPNQTASTVIPFPFSACSRTGPVILSVQAVQKGIGSTG
jgi:hypothetical protein